MFVEGRSPTDREYRCHHCVHRPRSQYATKNSGGRGALALKEKVLPPNS